VRFLAIAFIPHPLPLQCNPISWFYRKIQDALEKQNRESFKKRDHEKRKVDEATEKAKELMRVKIGLYSHEVMPKNIRGIPFVVIVLFSPMLLLVQFRTQFW